MHRQGLYFILPTIFIPSEGVPKFLSIDINVETNWHQHLW